VAQSTTCRLLSIGEEARLPPHKNVYQMTGVIEINGHAWEYLWLSPDQKALMVAQLRELGAEHALELSQLLYGLDSSLEVTP
jgi:hypothetical protein